MIDACDDTRDGLHEPLFVGQVRGRQVLGAFGPDIAHGGESPAGHAIPLLKARHPMSYLDYIAYALVARRGRMGRRCAMACGVQVPGTDATRSAANLLARPGIGHVALYYRCPAMLSVAYLFSLQARSPRCE